jgi:hypothetical protein
MMRNRLALLTALGVDNFGSGLAAVALPWLAPRLPGDALRPEPAAPPQVAVR